MALPAPHPHQSVVSDGRIVAHALSKISCLKCGSASHACRVPDQEVRAIYHGGYELAGVAPKSDAARARAFGKWLQAKDLAPRSVLEIGCGSGALLQELSVIWPEAECTGIDPALPGARSDRRLRLERGFVEDIPDDLRNLDLIVAVNVIEHVPSPGKFLACLLPHLAPNGKIVIVCPAAKPPNTELLFYDHLYSLTPEALGAAVRAMPLVARTSSLAPPAIGDFQMIVFDAGDRVATRLLPWPSFSTLWSERKSYLDCWSALDTVLLARTRSAARLVMFGGGQTAALLRAYAPRVWARTETIVLDEIGECWSLDKPMESYAKAVHDLTGAQVLIAAMPRLQQAISERLREDGLQSIRWDDLIAS
jgi:SAM-dependent methyltransferase